MTERIPYAKKEFKSNLSIHQEWKIFGGAQGCTPLDIDGFGLRMDRVPLPLHLPSSTPPSNPTIAPRPLAENPPRTEALTGIKGWLARAAAKPVPPPEPEKGPVLIEAFKEIKEWMNATGADNRPKAEPFDMLDIPQGMAAMGFSKGKIFAERWFNGRAFVGPTSIQERAGAMYPKDMIDEKTTKISWLIGFDSVRKKYEELIENLIYSNLSIQQVRKNIVRFMANNPRFYGTLHTNQYCKNDIQELHRQFQFQLNKRFEYIRRFLPDGSHCIAWKFQLFCSNCNGGNHNGCLQQVHNAFKNCSLHQIESNNNSHLDLRKG